MSLTSDELNFLIYRYLRECGFEHSAYAFGHESFVFKSTIDTAAVSPGALISFVQKGLQYTDIEAHLTADGTEIICDEPVSVSRAHTCRVKQKRRLFDAFDPIDNDYGSAEIDTAIRVQTTQRSQRCMTTAVQWHPHTGILAVGGADGTVRVWEFKEQNEQIYDNANGADTEPNAPRKKHKPYSLVATLTNNDGLSDAANTQTNTNADNDNAIVDTTTNQNGDGDDKPISVKRQRVSDDASMPPMPPSDTEPPLNLSITVVEWHQRGLLIAGGSYDGRVFLWNAKNHSLLHTLRHHSAPVTAVRFTQSANALITASVDGSIVNWDVNTGAIISIYRLHDGPALDCDTSPISETTWVSCGTNGSLFLYEQTDAHSTNDTRNTNGTESLRQQRRLNGHSGDVNTVRFDASGTLMASGGDDCVVRVWNVQTAVCNHALSDHQRAITSIRWSIHEQSTSSPSTLLASASLDCTANVYEVETGKLLYALNKHAQPVTAISFQPGNALIATASHERVHIWSVGGQPQSASDDENVLSGGTLVKTFRSDGVGGLIDCCWDHVGRRIAVASTDKCTFVIDLSNVIRSSS